MSHKGDFGHVLILAGCAQFSGAGLLCSSAAMRTGAGLVTLGIPEGLINAIIRKKSTEVILLPLAQTSQLTLSLKAYPQIKKILEKIDVVVLGPGLSQHRSTQGLIRKLIKTIEKPVLIDADGINALRENLNLLIESRRTREVILTPHPGELAGILDEDIKVIQSNRQDIARRFSKYYKLTLVLKGHQTVVADYQGNLYINKTGNPGMATAGSGDVLSGMIGALLAQGLKGFQAAKYAVYLHGLTGDLAAKDKTQISLIASDMIEKIPQAIKMSSR